MTTPAKSFALFAPLRLAGRQVLGAIVGASVIIVGTFVIWPTLAGRMLSSNFLPHLYCYLGKPGLVWTHVLSDSLIGMAYLTISGTLAYLVYKGRHQIPFRWMFVAFGLFIVACGGTHLMEVVTVWIPVYVLSGAFKVVTALVSVATAVLLPFTVPQVLSLVDSANAAESAEEKFRGLFEMAPDALVIVDKTGKIVLVNSQTQKLFGWGREELLGKSVKSLIPERFHRQHEAYQEQLFSDPRMRLTEPGLELHARRKNGGEFPVEISLSPLQTREGLLVTAAVRDTTQRQRAVEALRDSEDRYRDLVEHSQDLVCTHSLEGKLLSCNPAPARILGYEVAELLKIPMADLVAPEYREQFDGYLSKMRTTGQDQGLMVVVTRTGERRIWEYNNTLRTEGISAPVVRGMAHDITEQVQAEKSAKLFRMLIDQSTDSIEVIDPKTFCFIDINGRGCDDLGYTREELLSMKIFDIDPNVDEAMIARVEQELQESGSAIFESLHRRKDGSTFPVEVSLKEVHLDRVYRVSVARDISERKRAGLALRESQADLARLARIAAMGEVTASIAHEINQPLAAVVANASASLRWLALRPPELEEARDAMAAAMREGTRASEVIRRIRSQVTKASGQIEPLDANEIIREALALSGTELARGGVTVRTELAGDLPTVMGDRVQLHQVMQNLIANGIEAMSGVADRPRELFIRSARHLDSLLIQVQDSGTGLDPALANRIFEPFFTTKPQGIGVGLSISRSIVEGLGGRIWVSPGSSPGAVLQLILPQQENAA